MARRYDWGKGGKVHSIPLSKHKSNVRKRGERKRLNDPAEFTKPRSLSDVNRDAESATGLRYGETDRTLDLQSRQVPAWFAATQGQIAGIAQGVKTGYDQAIKDLGDQQTNTRTAEDKSRSDLYTQMQTDAASRGATVDPKLFADDLNAAAVRGQNAQNFAGLLTTQREANNTYFGGLGAAAGAAGLGQQTRIAEEQKGVAADKGLFRQQYVSDARGDERKYGLERSVFGLDVAKEQNKASADRARIRTTSRDKAKQRRATSRTERKTVITSGPFAGLTHGQVRKLTPGQKQQRIAANEKSKGPGKLSAEGLKAKKNIRSGVQQVRRHDNGLGSYWQEAFDELTGTNGLDPVVARAIIQGAKTGRLGPNTAKTLREDYGIDPKSLRFGKPKKRRKPKQTTVPPQAPGSSGQSRPT